MAVVQELSYARYTFVMQLLNSTLLVVLASTPSVWGAFRDVNPPWYLVVGSNLVVRHTADPVSACLQSWTGYSVCSCEQITHVFLAKPLLTLQHRLEIQCRCPSVTVITSTTLRTLLTS
jgi:hypothetical protein